MNVNQLEFFERDKVIKFEGVEGKVCTRCGTEYPFTEQFFSIHTVTSNGKTWLKGFCKCCEKEANKVVRELKKTAPPKPARCDCCGKKFKDLNDKHINLDHCRETGTFRGWLCTSCNQGLGKLGDTIEGLEKALDYLHRHKDRIDDG